jgi:hypothetical protein
LHCCLTPLRACLRHGDAQLRDALFKSRLAGSSLLPELPGKSLFAPSSADLVLRQRAFASLLDYLGQNEELAAADATCAFLSGACLVALSVFPAISLTARVQTCRRPTFASLI